MEPRQYSTLSLYRRLFALARPFSVHILGVMLLSLIATPVALLTPLPLKIVVDSVIGGQSLPTWLTWLLPIGAGSVLAVALVTLVAVGLLNEFQALSTWVLQTYVSEKLVLRFRAQLFAHAQRLSLGYHDARGSADSVYRIQNDAQAIQNLAINGLVPFVTSTVTLVAMIAVTMRLDRAMALIASALVPALFVLVRLSTRRLHEHWEDIKRSESSAMSVLSEVLGSLRVVKAFGQEVREQERFVERASRTMRGQIRLAWTQGSFDVLVGVTIAMGMGAALYVGAAHVQSGALSLGGLVVAMAYMAQLLAPVQAITKRIGQLQGSFAGAARAFSLLDETPDVIERPHARRLARATGAVQFEGVSFAYDRRQCVLENVTFEIAPGSRVGIAGHTGAGKTTLINLLARFYDPTSGVIRVDGVDLRDYRLGDLRNQFAFVLQEPVLFSTSLAENIAYARPGATFDEIVAAATAASAHGFISALPEGYETVVGERGLRLSGGERQRVSLARAFLEDAPILVLDEPTSSVDVATEHDIMDALTQLMRNRTTFVIAHRLSTLENCDVRLVLDHGRLAGATGIELAVV